MLSKLVMWLIPVIWIVLAWRSHKALRCKMIASDLAEYFYWHKRHRLYMWSCMPFGIATGFFVSQLIQQY